MTLISFQWKHVSLVFLLPAFFSASPSVGNELLFCILLKALRSCFHQKATALQGNSFYPEAISLNVHGSSEPCHVYFAEQFWATFSHLLAWPPLCRVKGTLLQSQGFRELAAPWWHSAQLCFLPHRYGIWPFGVFKKLGIPGPTPLPFFGTCLEYRKVSDWSPPGSRNICVCSYSCSWADTWRW